MNNEDQVQLQQANAQLLASLAEQVKILQRDNAVLKHKAILREEVDMAPDVAQYVVGHLQVKPLDSDHRKQALGKFRRLKGLPKALTDSNGFAAKAVGDGPQKKWVLNSLPAMQREDLDVVRVAASALNDSLSIPQDDPRFGQLLQNALAQVCALACDNAQRKARTQLELIFEAAGTKGAATLLKNGDNFEDNDLDPDDTNILRQGHVDAMENTRKYLDGIKTARGGKTGASKQGRQRRGQRSYRGRTGGGYRGRGRGGFGSWRGGGGYSASYGGGGRGSGSPPNGGSGQ